MFRLSSFRLFLVKTVLLMSVRFAFWFTSGVYLLALPVYGVLVAFPSGVVDALFPFEFVLCCVLSGCMFVRAVRVGRELVCYVP